MQNLWYLDIITCYDLLWNMLIWFLCFWFRHKILSIGKFWGAYVIQKLYENLLSLWQDEGEAHLDRFTTRSMRVLLGVFVEIFLYKRLTSRGVCSAEKFLFMNQSNESISCLVLQSEGSFQKSMDPDFMNKKTSI